MNSSDINVTQWQNDHDHAAGAMDLDFKTDDDARSRASNGSLPS